MKILVLTKRQYMGKDLLDDHFGRFWELPFELIRLGHDVQGLALSYQRRPTAKLADVDGSSDIGVIWSSINLLTACLPQIERYTRRALQIAREFCPDIIWTGSDAYHAVFGSWLAKRVKSRCVIDLYDNFEAFTASQIPGVLPLFRRAVKAADGVSVFSRRLADHVARKYLRSKPIVVIENGVRHDLFRPLDQTECRERLALPQHAKIIGTAGALDQSRGIETFFRAFEQLSGEADDLHLALAGPRERGLAIPAGPKVHDFNELPHGEVPFFYNSLDAAVVCYRHSAQGEYSFPQKAYEIIACRVPLVAAAVGSMNELLRNYPDCLYEPEDSTHLANTLTHQLHAKRKIEIKTPSWADSSKQLSDFFLRITEGDSPPAGRTK
jgi:glycosyltransferase involved in cell wall biosynthesis